MKKKEKTLFEKILEDNINKNKFNKKKSFPSFSYSQDFSIYDIIYNYLIYKNEKKEKKKWREEKFMKNF